MQPIMKFCPDEEELVLEIFKTLGSGRTIKVRHHFVEHVGIAPSASMVPDVRSVHVSAPALPIYLAIAL
jgi:hypothetical protein